MNEIIETKQHRELPSTLLVGLGIGLVALGWMGVKADLALPASPSVPAAALYIPSDYSGYSPSSNNQLQVKVGSAGIGNECIRGITADFTFNPNQIQFDAAPLTFSDKFGGAAVTPSATVSVVTADPPVSKLHLVFGGVNFVHFETGDEVLRLKFAIKDGLAPNSTTLNVDVTDGMKTTVKPYSAGSCSGTMGYSSALTDIASGKIKIIPAPVAACTVNQFWNCTAWNTSACATGGSQSRTCTEIANRTCSGTVAKPAESQACACATAADWECGDWGACQNGNQTRTCNPKNNCTGSAGKVTSQSCTLTKPNCFAPLQDFEIPGTSIRHGSVHPNLVLRTPGEWTLENSTFTVTADKPKVLPPMMRGEYAGKAPDVAGECQFKVECYTSIDTVGAKKSMGSNDPAALMLYDFDKDGEITVDDKVAIFNASQTCQ